ncbi:hypothetical protein KP509_09G000800 [Ceratopteris richardii]|nr:hypothetical protein KP509_09G000800 [Ceratopteris richardii]
MDLDRIQDLHKQLQEDNETSKSVTQPDAVKNIKKKMEAHVDEVIKITRSVKTKLEKLDKDNLANRKKSGCEEGTSVDRSRLALTSALKRKLQKLLNEFQALRQRIQDEYRTVVERRVFIVTGEKPDAEVVDTLIETGEGEKIFTKAMQSQGRGQIIGTLAEIEERHEAVRDLEKKLLELHQIFLDMAVLVEAQGEILDNIEAQVSKAAEYTEAGVKIIQKAKKLQKNKRKWALIAMILLLVIIIVIVIPVMQPWKDRKA